VAALTASTVTPLVALYQGRWLTAAILAVMVLAIYLAHRSNLIRLTRGEEAKIDLGKKPAR